MSRRAGGGAGTAGAERAKAVDPALEERAKPKVVEPTLLDRAKRILAKLKKAYPDAECALHHGSPLDLYVATVLSAQCTDARVNQVTPALFARCRTPEDYLALGPEGLEAMIRSTGFFRAKTRSILGTCAVLVEHHGGKVPGTMEELLELPGVGRKTANVILGEAFDTPGITVDTHVGRVSRRLELTDEEDPVKVEFALQPLFPQKKWTKLSHLLIAHGRTICQSRKPQCEICPLAAECPYPERVRGEAPRKAAAKKPRAAAAKTAAKVAAKTPQSLAARTPTTRTAEASRTRTARAPRTTTAEAPQTKPAAGKPRAGARRRSSP